MYKTRIIFLLAIILFLNGCVSMKYPKWSKNGFTSEHDIYEWKKCGVHNPKVALAYRNCGIKRYKVCGIRKYNISTPVFANIKPEKACQWNLYMYQGIEDLNTDKLVLSNAELIIYTKANVNPQNMAEWNEVFKLDRVRGWIAYNNLSKGKKGISKANLVRVSIKNNLKPNDIKKWANISMLQGWKYIDEAGEWKKHGITFDELENTVKYITIHENQFKKTTPELAKKYKSKGYKFKAIYFGLENNINIKDLSELKDNYNIDYKKGIIFLKYFSVNDVIKLNINFESNTYSFEDNVKYAQQFKNAGMNVADISNWLTLYKPKNKNDIETTMTDYRIFKDLNLDKSYLKNYNFKNNLKYANMFKAYGMNIADIINWVEYYKPENVNDARSAISHYKNKISANTAYKYKKMYLSSNTIKKYERIINKNCKIFTWSNANPFDMKGKCIKLRQLKQEILLSRKSAIYLNLDSWIKISSDSSAPKYFSGVVKITGTSKFTTKSGLKTIIPIGKMITSY